MAESKRYPTKGERYLVTSEFRAPVLTKWLASFTGGDEKTLPVGFQFVVEHDPLPGATGVGVLAEPYEKWEPLLVDSNDLSAEKYSGYYLVILFEQIETFCRPL